MLSALTGATQVKLESSDDTFLESLSSPLLSPLEIKTEKGYYNHPIVHHHQLQAHNNNNSNINNNNVNVIQLSHLGHNHSSNNNNNNNNSNHNNNNNNSYSVQSHYNNPQAHPNHQQLNGYHHQDFNIHHGHVPHQQYSNNYYNWQQNNHHHQHHATVPVNQQASVYGNNKYSSASQSNLCAPISRLMYVPPLTPPSSDPGSPGNSIQVSIV